MFALARGEAQNFCADLSASWFKLLYHQKATYHGGFVYLKLVNLPKLHQPLAHLG
jgi:hypothetical protein